MISDAEAIRIVAAQIAGKSEAADRVIELARECLARRVGLAPTQIRISQVSSVEDYYICEEHGVPYPVGATCPGCKMGANWERPNSAAPHKR